MITASKGGVKYKPVSLNCVCFFTVRFAAERLECVASERGNVVVREMFQNHKVVSAAEILQRSLNHLLEPLITIWIHTPARQRHVGGKHTHRGMLQPLTALPLSGQQESALSNTKRQTCSWQFLFLLGS